MVPARYCSGINVMSERMRLFTRLSRTISPLRLGEAITLGDRTLEPAIVVTGASEGLGRAFSSNLATRTNVVMIARSAEDLRQAASDIAKKSAPASVKWLALDVSRDDAPRRVREFLDQSGYYVDVLVNNAGTAAGGRFDLQDREAVMAIIDLNVRGLVALTHEFLPADERNAAIRYRSSQQSRSHRRPLRQGSERCSRSSNVRARAILL